MRNPISFVECEYFTSHYIPRDGPKIKDKASFVRDRKIPYTLFTAAFAARVLYFFQ